MAAAPRDFSAHARPEQRDGNEDGARHQDADRALAAEQDGKDRGGQQHHRGHLQRLGKSRFVAPVVDERGDRSHRERRPDEQGERVFLEETDLNGGHRETGGRSRGHARQQPRGSIDIWS